MNNKIAVITPIYKAHQYVKSMLHSVAMQRYVDFNHYLIVDGESVGSYDYLLIEFPNIVIYYIDNNVGPGLARQYGIDNTDEPFLTFIDADDTLLTSLSLAYQQIPFFEGDGDKLALVSCDFLQENKNKTLILKENDMVWMHSKMYRREFLDKYNIRFNDTRANEDVGFNTICQCLANEDERIFMSKNQTYLWQWRDDSIVRRNEFEFSYNESVDGYVINKLYAFNHAISIVGIDDSIRYFIISAMAQLYKKYLGALLKAPKQVKHINKWARKFYKEMYSRIEQEYIDKAMGTALVHVGFKLQVQHDEYYNWIEMLKG